MTYINTIFVRTTTKIMDAKLTLRLDKNSIDRAKNYASMHNTSLSRMVENFFRTLEPDPADEMELSPLVRKLSGVIQLPEDFDYRQDRENHLAKKHSL